MGVSQFALSHVIKYHISHEGSLGRDMSVMHGMRVHCFGDGVYT